MLIMTMERCLECHQLIYMRLARKAVADENMIIGDGCYLDDRGVMTVVAFDEDTVLPDYCCIHCGWFA